MEKKENNISEIESSQDEFLLQDEERKNKLLKLMGGKKEKNKSKADEWLSNTRSYQDEKTLSKNIESQFHHSLDKKLNGDTRRKQGLGFVNLDKEGSTPKSQSSDVGTGSRARSRSRSPLCKKVDVSGSADCVSKTSGLSHGDCKKTNYYEQMKKDKKNFYSQFKKSSQ